MEKRAREWWTEEGGWASSKGNVLAISKSCLSHCVLDIRVNYHLLTFLLEGIQQVRIVFGSSVLWETCCKWKHINTSSYLFIHSLILCLIKMLFWKNSRYAWKQFPNSNTMPRGNHFHIFLFIQNRI